VSLSYHPRRTWPLLIRSNHGSGFDSRAGTIIHENSHFDNNGGTDDYAYGQEDAQNLAKEDPETAIQNADNVEYL
jgi:peptidyl-Lys metalloendopeptidase